MADEEDKHASRQEAIALGLKYYFTGEPCKNGHVSKRLLANNGCVVCTLERNREYAKTHKRHVRSRNRKYSEKTKERRRELERLRYAKDPTKHKNKVKAYYAINGETVREKRRQLHQKNRMTKSTEYKMLSVSDNGPRTIQTR